MKTFKTKKEMREYDLRFDMAVDHIYRYGKRFVRTRREGSRFVVYFYDDDCRPNGYPFNCCKAPLRSMRRKGAINAINVFFNL